MNFYNENFGNRVLEVLTYPLMHRCPELGLLFDRCSIRELQELFPAIINSIFSSNGGIGWGLRTITKEAIPQDFEVLYNFFIPLGPMFRLCYRLLNDTIKFEFSCELLPHKMSKMLQSGQYSMFYADLLNVDPFRRSITSLSLNAFDYFILNFIIHGTVPLHRMFPAALAVHNEKTKTAYFFLTADYLCSFLPSNPNTVVLPTNICGTVKASQPIPVQPLQPTRSPKYLTLSPISHFTTSNNSTVRTPESPRTYAWRTESVLYLFVDIWLRYDVDEIRDLPSSEFIRVVRILVKQLHAFGNSADIDNTSMAVLRKLAPLMINARIYWFLKSIISRWPLDSSFSVVLELWLSYLQPWRYTFDRNIANMNADIPITTKYEAFISDNLIVFTQIFVLILPRFERLDYTSIRNVIMLHRLIKVFSQNDLPELIQNCEQKLSQTLCTMTSSPQASSPKHSLYYRNKQSASNDWESFRPNKHFHDENYIYMFGEEVKTEIQLFLKILFIAKMYVLDDIEVLNKKCNVEKRGFIRNILHSIGTIFHDDSIDRYKVKEIKNIPDMLDVAAQALTEIFNVNLPDIAVEHLEHQEFSHPKCNPHEEDDIDELDISKISPTQMRNSIVTSKLLGDPDLLPIQTHECKFLVRFLNQVSSKLNLMFADEMKDFWYRNDFWGKLSRQILNPPITIKCFDKSTGISRLREDRLQPRVCLRFLASYKTLILIPISLTIGLTLWGVPSIGLLLLFTIIFIYAFILALLS